MDELVVRTSVDVPTRATAAFIASHLPSGGTVLEVGCGEGRVALELLNRGYHVLGVDSDEEAIARAKERGVPALQASWPEFGRDPFDGVAFTRSLHHIGPLQKAIRKARELVRPTGVLLVEDFAFDAADKATIGWFLEILGSQTAKILIAPVRHEFVTDLLESKDPVASWNQHHDHELHTMAAMTQAIAECFVIREPQHVPYLYRYLVPVLPETLEAAAFIDEVAREESRLGERGAIVLIGRRIVSAPDGNIA
ncbi:MAG TPA: class I SAM-dependent methyltransferase [Casimicrobiaceae bacterium]|nr:class I SAM-dependent methyltransferase [Casimicrobiaceae bacterium]